MFLPECVCGPLVVAGKDCVHDRFLLSDFEKWIYKKQSRKTAVLPI
jgi:hypothetical protein